MRRLSVLIDYEAVLMRQHKQYHLKGKDADVTPKSAKEVLRYAFERILHWSPYNVRDYFTPEVSRKLKLENCIDSVPFPVELDRTRDYFFVASWLYPDVIPYQKDRIILDIYNKVCNKTYKSFPKGFFHEEAGRENLLIVIRYNLSQQFFGKTAEEIYDYFSVRMNANAFAKNANIDAYWREHYPDLVSAVHDALPEGDRDDLYFHYAQFMFYFNIAKTRKD